MKEPNEEQKMKARQLLDQCQGNPFTFETKVGRLIAAVDILRRVARANPGNFNDWMWVDTEEPNNHDRSWGQEIDERLDAIDSQS